MDPKNLQSCQNEKSLYPVSEQPGIKQSDLVVDHVYNSLKNEFDKALIDLELDIRRMYDEYVDSIFSELEKDKVGIRKRLESEVFDWRKKYDKMCDLCIMVETDFQEELEVRNARIVKLECQVEECGKVTKEIKKKEGVVKLEKIKNNRITENLRKKSEKNIEDMRILNSKNFELKEVRFIKKLKEREEKIIKLVQEVENIKNMLDEQKDDFEERMGVKDNLINELTVLSEKRKTKSEKKRITSSGKDLQIQELTALNESLNKKVEDQKTDFERQVKDLNYRIEEVQGLNDVYKKEVEDMMHRELVNQKEYKSQNILLTQQLEKLESKISKTEDEIRRKEKEWDQNRIDLQAQTELLKKQITESRGQISSKGEEISRVRASETKIKKILETKEDEVKQLQDRILSAGETNQYVKDKIRQLETDLKKQMLENENLVEQLHVIQRETETNKTENMRKVEENMKMKETEFRDLMSSKVTKLEEMVSSKTRDITSVKSTLEKQLNDLKRRKNEEISDMRHTIDELEMKEKRLKKKLKELNSGKERVAIDLSELQTKNDFLESQISSKMKQLTSTKEEFENYRNQVSGRTSQLVQENQNLKKEYSKVEESLGDRDLKITKYQSRVEEVLSRNKHLLEETEMLNRKHLETKKEYESMLKVKKSEKERLKNLHSSEMKELLEKTEQETRRRVEDALEKYKNNINTSKEDQQDEKLNLLDLKLETKEKENIKLRSQLEDFKNLHSNESAEHDSQVLDLKKMHDHEMKEYQQQLKETIEKYENETKAKQIEHDKEKQGLKNEYSVREEQKERVHQSQLEEMKKKHKMECSSLKSSLNMTIEQKEKELENTLRTEMNSSTEQKEGVIAQQIQKIHELENELMLAKNQSSKHSEGMKSENEKLLLQIETLQKEKTVLSLKKRSTSESIDISNLSPIKSSVSHTSSNDTSSDGIDLNFCQDDSGSDLSFNSQKNKTLQPGDYLRMINKRRFQKNKQNPQKQELNQNFSPRKIVRGRPKLRRSMSFVSKNNPHIQKLRKARLQNTPRWKQEEHGDEGKDEEEVKKKKIVKKVIIRKKKKKKDPNEIPVKKSDISKEFFYLDNHFEMIPMTEYSIALESENRNQNRYGDILPYDKTLVALERKKKNSNQYINASHVNVNGVKYIAAQWPLDDESKGINTENEWWSMIFEQDVKVVLSLQRPGPPKHPYYFPKKEKEVKMTKKWAILNEGNNVTTSYREIKCLLCEKKKMKKYQKLKKKIEKRRLKNNNDTSVEEDDEDDDPNSSKSFLIDGVNFKTVTVITFMIWPDMGLPSEMESLKSLMERIDVLNHEDDDDEEEEKPILVHCSAGVGRTGVFIVSHSLLSKKRKEGNASIFEIEKTLRSVREQRNKCVQTIHQYEFCYSFIWKYIKK